MQCMLPTLLNRLSIDQLYVQGLHLPLTASFAVGADSRAAGTSRTFRLPSKRLVRATCNTNKCNIQSLFPLADACSTTGRCSSCPEVLKSNQKGKKFSCPPVHFLQGSIPAEALAVPAAQATALVGESPSWNPAFGTAQARKTEDENSIQDHNVTLQLGMTLDATSRLTTSPETLPQPLQWCSHWIYNMHRCNARKQDMCQTTSIPAHLASRPRL